MIRRLCTTEAHVCSDSRERVGGLAKNDAEY